MITPYDYQRRTIDMTFDWLRQNDGNLVIVLPTGAGKSVVNAFLCKESLQSWPDTRILMVTSRKELIEQNADKMRKVWPNAPLGIYSASIGKRDIDGITFAGIASIYNRAAELGPIDVIIIDECHEISHDDEGMYRTLFRGLKEINPYVRIIGLTATPYRMGFGSIVEPGSLFTDSIEPVSIIELQAKGHLAKLTSKPTDTKLDVSGVHLSGGDYKQNELQTAVDVDLTNHQVVDEVIRKAGDRKSWLFFCSGIEHSLHIRDLLRERGITAETITGETPKVERAKIIDQFRYGKIQALTNANVLTTGFDAPDIDLIVMLRPTKSPGLYVQMAGRGLRKKSHGGNCLVLDFAGVVALHGPITAVNPPKKKGEGNGVAPSKECPECDEIIAIQCKTCPCCGHVFTVEEEKKYQLHTDDIMGEATVFESPVYSWSWDIQKSKKSGLDMVVVTYYGGNLSEPIKEYLCLWHEGFASIKAKKLLDEIILKSDAGDIEEIETMNKAKPPSVIKYTKDGKFNRIIDRVWEQKFEDAIPF